ncbi:MAG: hypothetical protein FWG64_08745 [Firmicutes bacterium]|nr:hypothetical protein [Bacillota bacterium]
MKATFSLDKENSRFVFEAEDFYLRFAIAPTIKSIDKVILNENGYFRLICGGNEVEIFLTDVTDKMDLIWDFSKYEIEVI